MFWRVIASSKSRSCRGSVAENLRHSVRDCFAHGPAVNGNGLSERHFHVAQWFDFVFKAEAMPDWRVTQVTVGCSQAGYGFSRNLAPAVVRDTDAFDRRSTIAADAASRSGMALFQN